eukprot:TRINITY_DN3849_c0_g3_i2.p1 TRINITY_DN3849_c0_g3~~TRINITY_DN3849_c0_g3_i2.p1  ORF type:complete len:147 (+),score=6.25 TRINITY_DN3849_c0_g3_i2:1104-1544(+)
MSTKQGNTVPPYPGAPRFKSVMSAMTSQLLPIMNKRKGGVVFYQYKKSFEPSPYRLLQEAGAPRFLCPPNKKPFIQKPCLSVLPDLLLLHIISFLPIKDVFNMSFLSRRWYGTIDFTSWLEPAVCSQISYLLKVYEDPEVLCFMLV